MPGQLPTHIFTIMCEDIRAEAGHKLSLLGIYSEDIFFKTRPMRMRSLAFYNRFSGGNGTFLVTGKLKSPSAEVKEFQIKDFRLPRSKDSKLTHIGSVIGNVEFTGEGQHLYEIYFDDIPDPIVRLTFGVYVRPDVFDAK